MHKIINTLLSTDRMMKQKYKYIDIALASPQKYQYWLQMYFSLSIPDYDLLFVQLPEYLDFR